MPRKMIIIAMLVMLSIGSGLGAVPITSFASDSDVGMETDLKITEGKMMEFTYDVPDKFLPFISVWTQAYGEAEDGTGLALAYFPDCKNESDTTVLQQMFMDFKTEPIKDVTVAGQNVTLSSLTDSDGKITRYVIIRAKDRTPVFFGMTFSPDQKDQFDSFEEYLASVKDNSEDIKQSLQEDAEAETHPEAAGGMITFRDLKWKMSFPDVEKQMYDCNFSTMSFGGMMANDIDNIIALDDSSAYYNYQNNGINMVASSTLNGKVAGYDLDSFSLYFAYTDPSAICGQDNSKTSLYAARYDFEAKNLKGMTKDLTDKMSSLYGKPVDTKTDVSSFDTKNYTYWYGEDGTEAIFTTFDRKDDAGVPDWISITYATTEADDLLHTIDDAVSAYAGESEAANYGSGDVDGL